MSTETDTAAIIQAIQTNAKRLGLTWDLTMAAVNDGSGEDPSNVQIVFDSDADSGAVTAGAISMIGAVAPGERVYVATVPPAGNYIIGSAFVVGTKLVARGQRSAAKTGITVESGLVGVEWQGLGGHSYYITSMMMIIASTVNEAAQVAARLNIATGGTLAGSGVGAQLGSNQTVTQAGTGGGFGLVDGHFQSTIDQILSVATTARRIVGAGTLSVSNGSGAGPELFVYDLGRTLTNVGRTL